MSVPILKRNLVEGQIVYFFPQPGVKENGIELYNKKSTIQELEFLEISKRHGVQCVYFYKVGTNGAKKKFYDSIKGLLYHSHDEAKQAFDEQLIEAKKKILVNIRKQMIKLEKLEEALQEELSVEELGA